MLPGLLVDAQVASQEMTGDQQAAAFGLLAHSYNTASSVLRKLGDSGLAVITAASLVILWRYLRGDSWREPWYAWTLVACATAVSVALNVAHAPDQLSAQLFAALPPVALLGALELLMSVARTGLPHTTRTETAEDRSSDRDPTATAVARPQLTAPDHHTSGGNGSGPPRDSRTRVRELVAHERATGTRLAARQVAAAVGISERRAYELLRAVRTEDQQP
jgi:hypothetical protein